MSWVILKMDGAKHLNPKQIAPLLLIFTALSLQKELKDPLVPYLLLLLNILPS